jgi:RecB family exonuclease
VRIPSTEQLHQLYFSQPEPSSQDARLLAPAGITWQAAHRDDHETVSLPPAWVASESSALSLNRMRQLQMTLRTSVPGAMDGLLPADWPLSRPRGLEPDLPLSATRAKRLVECPHRFFLQDILGWQESTAAPSMRGIETLRYGSLLHSVAEQFFRTHGEDFTNRKEPLAHWHTIVETLAKEAFDYFLEEYPLLGGPVRQQQLARLQADVRRLLQYEWDERADLKFVAAEEPFGHPQTVRLQLGDHVLYVQGLMDRLDIRSGRLLIRDIKSGRAHPRQGTEAGPTHTLDVQLALYALAADAARDDGQVDWPSVGEVAYVYASDIRAHPERCFGGTEFSEFMQEGREWLGAGAALVATRLFPHSPNSDDCTFCPFQTLCDRPSMTSFAEKLSQLDGPQAEAAQRFRKLKLGEPDDVA